MFFDFKKCKTTDKNTNILIQKPWCFKFVTEQQGKCFSHKSWLQLIMFTQHLRIS